MEGGAQVILYHVIISIFLALILGKEENIPTNYDVGIMIFIFIYTTLYGWAWVPLSWLVLFFKALILINSIIISFSF
jgi:hypothetical protein